MENETERLVGISSYISDLKGFSGIIKQRFSDFQVNEITSAGKIVHLTSEEVIPIPEAPVIAVDINNKPPEISDEEIEHLKLISGQKDIKEVKPSSFIVKLESGNDYKKQNIKNYKKELKINVKELTKERRTALHLYIKSRFSNLNSTTKDFNNQKFIFITRNENTQRKDKRNCWPKSQGYVNFVLYKENVDTMEAVNTIAGKLRLKPGLFCYAGTKDKRAITSQLVSVYQVSPQNIFSAVQRISKIKVGNFFYNNKPQKLGQAQGNHFRIAIREVNASNEEVELAVTSLKEKGFINYFGMQRFSSSSVSTHAIGRAILQGKWSEAVDLILKPRDNDFPDLVEAKKIWMEKRNPSLARRSLKPFRKHSIEGQLLSGLEECGVNNFVNALEKIPRNVNLMYIHAYQSYIWNSVLSRRIEKYKLKVLPGDLIRPKKKNTLSSALINESEESLREKEDEDEIDQQTDSHEQILSEDEAKCVDITEVIMPLPGYNIVYPKNEIKDWYREYLLKDGLSFEMFRHKVKTYSLGGAYRSIVVRPQNLDYSICSYDDAMKPLIQSDYEALKKEDVLTNRLQEGKYKALILEVSLPTSSYATMALRELMKIETSSAYQTTLNSKSNCKEATIEPEGSEEVDNNSQTICDDTEVESSKRKQEFDSENSSEKKTKL